MAVLGLFAKSADTICTFEEAISPDYGTDVAKNGKNRLNDPVWGINPQKVNGVLAFCGADSGLFTKSADTVCTFKMTVI